MFFFIYNRPGYDTVCLSWIKKQFSKEYHMVLNEKTNHPSNFFRLPLIFVTDKIKQHVLFLTSGNSDECF